LFEFKKMIAGIDISYESIKAVCVEHRGRKKRVTGMVEIPLSAPIIESDHIKDKEGIAELIKKGLSQAKPHPIKAKFAVIEIPDFLVFSKTLQLPKMREDELKTAALNQAAQYIPVSLVDVNVDSQILIAHPDEPVVDVLVLATPKALVEEYLQVFNLVGLEIMSIETKALATSRAVAPSKNHQGDLILEIGSTGSRITIAEEGNVRFVLTTNIGGDQIIQSMLPEPLDHDHFIEAKYKQGLSINPEAGRVVVGKISEEIIKAIRYHQTRDYRASQITKIQLCGSSALIPELAVEIQKQVNIRTELAKFSVDHLPEGFSQKYTVSLGLALYKEGPL